jgi:DNA-directed RNA polymerase subunit RPC12/RpoP
MKNSYMCKSCNHITDFISRKPNFCPECGREGIMSEVPEEVFEQVVFEKEIEEFPYHCCRCQKEKKETLLFEVEAKESDLKITEFTACTEVGHIILVCRECMNPKEIKEQNKVVKMFDRKH